MAERALGGGVLRGLVEAVLLDIGGVVLTKGWDRNARRRAAELFGYDHAEAENRHDMVFHSYEEGNLTLDQYLDQVIFFKDRAFRRDDYKAFMFAQSGSYPDMLQLIAALKAAYGLKIVALSNEGRELALYRVEAFGLSPLVDFFVFSSFVYLRKPDQRIYRLALDQVLLPLDHVVFIDDTPLNVEVARQIGITSIAHTDRDSTANELAEMGLTVP